MKRLPIVIIALLLFASCENRNGGEQKFESIKCHPSLSWLEKFLPMPDVGSGGPKKLSNQLYTYHQNLFPFVQSKEDPDEFDSEFFWQGMTRLGETFYACDNDDVVVNQAYLLGIISKEEYDTWKANKYDPNATRESFVSQLESALEVGEIYSADNDEEGLSSSGLITTQKNADLDLETIPLVSAYWTVEKNVKP